MNYKPLVLFSALILFSTGIVFGQKGETEAQKTMRLAGMLPESDGIVTLNSKKLFGEALPQILTANQPMLSDINGHVENIRQRAGIDIKQFDRVVIGSTMKETTPGEVAFDPVVLAQGKYDLATLQTMVRLASANDFREEKVGDKTIYIFTIKKLTDAPAPKGGDSYLGKMFGMIVKGFSNEIAVSAFDKDIVAFGPAERVRKAIRTGPRVGLSVLSLPGLQRGGLASFGARMTVSMSKFIPLDVDELGQNIDSIKFLSGFMDLGAGGNTVVQVKARTTLPAQAQELHTALNDLQDLGKMLIGGARGPDKAVYARMIENAKFTRAGNEITLDLQVPQADINILVAEKK